MNNVIDKLKAPLKKEDIEVRIGNANPAKKGFSLLLYKTARIDVARLNDVCGMLWKPRFFYDQKGLLCCGISIYNTEIKEWIERVDVGTESMTEKEKGLYSDAQKRAGFKWGIGAELYKLPFVYINNWPNWYKNKKGIEVPSFMPSNVEITEYVVENGIVKKLEISYSGRNIYSHGKNYIPEMTEAEKKEIEEKKALAEIKQQIGIVLVDLTKAGVNKVAIKNSIKHHLGVEELKDCNDLVKLKEYYLKKSNDLINVKKEK